MFEFLKNNNFLSFKKSNLPHQGDESYPKVAIKVININDMSIKILFFYSCIPPHVFRPQKDAKEMRVYLFSIYIYIYIYIAIIIITLFTLGVTLIGQSKLPQMGLKLPQV